MSKPIQTPGAKMMYLIKRRSGVSHDELVAHWFANHMPGVITSQQLAASAGKRAAWRYIATVFDTGAEDEQFWDGVAQLWFENALGTPDVPIGTHPTDTFQQKADPYVPWATLEYVAMDGDLPLVPLTLNPAFPCTRSGFHKIIFLVEAKPDIDHDALYSHWLDVHVPNAVEAMARAGGFRYVVSHSIHGEAEPYAGMAELYFPDSSCWVDFISQLEPDGMENFVERSALFSSQTEMIGIP